MRLETLNQPRPNLFRGESFLSVYRDLITISGDYSRDLLKMPTIRFVEGSF